MKRLLGAVFIVLGVGGGIFAAAPSASAIEIHGRQDITIPDSPDQIGPCLRLNVTIFGNTIGTGSEPICL